MRYVKVTDDKERKRILKQLGAQSNKRRCGLLGILYTDELTIYVLNTPGPHWMFCLIVDYNDHRYCLRGDCIYSRIIWNIDIIETAITDSDEIKKIDERFVPFLNICKEHHTAVRIGVNHGSLSDRIMSRYGDTPEGMVESCMEFLRICVREHFSDVVISIKASNTVVMVRTVRLLVAQMTKEGMAFPLHLGVTEAGEGEDGRIKSAVGIGALLCEGIGDTIRVSLSEAPEREIPVAKKLVDSIEECATLREQAKNTISDDTVTVEFHEKKWEDLQLKAAMTVGALFIDQLAHKLVIRNDGFTEEKLTELADAILQAARIKFTKTEYISCPGCGRTLYNLEETIAKIRGAVSQRAQHDKRFATLKIGIMGCIVNGPGEMADADYGYVGAAMGKVSLYKQKVCIEKNIPESEAVERLMNFIENDLNS